MDYKALLTTMLVKHEGLRLKPYRCTAGKLTIGVGRNLDDNGISQAEAMQLLQNDIDAVINSLKLHFPWYITLDGARKFVLVDMCFNMGITRLCGFKETLKLIEKGKYFEASQEMLNSQWAKQVGQRAIDDSKMMQTGVIPQ